MTAYYLCVPRVGPVQLSVLTSMPTAWLRFAYACEFLLAVVAVFTMWSQVGGQSHLDLMPWYWKMGLGGGLSAAIVAVTAAIAGRPEIWTRRSVAWILLAVALIAGIAAVTYYYHLQELLDESDSEEGTTALLAPVKETRIG